MSYNLQFCFSSTSIKNISQWCFSKLTLDNFGRLQAAKIHQLSLQLPVQNVFCPKIIYMDCLLHYYHNIIFKQKISIVNFINRSRMRHACMCGIYRQLAQKINVACERALKFFFAFFKFLFLCFYSDDRWHCIKCHHHKKKVHEKLFLNNHEYVIYDNANVSATWHHFHSVSRPPQKPPSPPEIT